MQQDEVISCSRGAIFAIPPSGVAGRPLALGIVEDFSATGQFSTEVLMSLGRFTGQATVVNNKQARCRWGKVAAVNDQLRNITEPDVAHYTAWKAFDLIMMDVADNKAILRLVGCGPESVEMTGTNGRALRENWSGVAQNVEVGSAVITG